MLPEQNINKSGNTAVEDEAVETIEVNLDEELEVEDSTADVNIAAKLPAHGIYTCQWAANKKDNSIYASRTKSEPHRSFVGAGLVGTIQDEEFEGTQVYVNHINSLQQRGKPTSELHHFLNVVGNPAPNRTTVGELKSFTESTLEQTPLGMAEIDWKASYKNDKGDWIDIATTMSRFPKHYVDADGNPLAKEKGGGR